MATACIASTVSITLSQDGLGTLRADAIRDPHPSNPIYVGAAGLVIRPTVGPYGYPYAGDDTYATAGAIGPVNGYVSYGPELFARTRSPVAGGILIALVTWEIAADYVGNANNPFSGIAFQLQYSYDHTNWGPVADAAQASPSGQSWAWHCHAQWPIAWGDTDVHNVWFRMLAAAGNFGSGENITLRYTRKRSCNIIY